MNIRPTILTVSVVLWTGVVMIAFSVFGWHRNVIDGQHSYTGVDYSLPYWNSDLPIEERAHDLLARMTEKEKIGQLALVEHKSVNHIEDVTTFGLGGIMSGGGGYPTPNTPAKWLEMVRAFEDASRKSRLGIPILYGVDANHGHGNVFGATLFPHALGLGATNNPDLVHEVAKATAEEVIATGIYWNFSPSLDVVRDTRWGRTYETFGSDTTRVTRLGTAYLV